MFNLLQFQPCNNSFPDLVHYSCAKGTCQRCPQMRAHPVLMQSNKFILFHAYKIVTTCTEHGVLSTEPNGCCEHCDNKRQGVIGIIYKKRQLVIKRTRYKQFFNQYYFPALLKYLLKLLISSLRVKAFKYSYHQL